MKSILLSLAVAIGHIAFLFFAYATNFFGLHLPARVATALWLGASSLAAGLGYYFASSRETSGRSISLALVATGVSLYVGTFLAFNAFGT